MGLSSPPKHVDIIGAGLSVRCTRQHANVTCTLADDRCFQGLALALAFYRNSIACTIYEARPESFDLGGGVLLSPNALRVLDTLGVYDRIKAKAYHFETFEFKDEAGTTTDIYHFGSKELYGYKAFRIIRRLLIDELKAMVVESGIDIIYNAKLTNIVSESADEVVFELQNGLRRSTPLLVGADGIQSSVRRFFDPVRPVYSGITGISSTVPRSRLRVPTGYHLPTTVIAKAGAFFFIPQEVDGSQVLVGAQRRFPERDKEGWETLAAKKDELRSMLRENADDWPDIVQSALEGLPVENMFVWPFYHIPKLDKWASAESRVIIVGDAAHAIPPTAGQGVNQAFEDVHMLAILLSKLSPKISLPHALGFWETYRQARVEKVLELTHQMNARRLPPAEQAKLPPGAVWKNDSTQGDGEQLRWLYEPDLDKDVASWVQQQEKN